MVIHRKIHRDIITTVGSKSSLVLDRKNYHNVNEYKVVIRHN